jgi:capsular polysaccharide transport system permease protein
MLVDEGERYMNLMAHRLAQEQVGFIERQVSQLSDRLMDARRAVLNYQNERNMVSPQGTAENLFAIVNQLEGQLATLKTQRDALLGIVHPKSPAVIDLDLQIAAVKKQIAQEQTRLTSSDTRTLNTAIEEFQRLQMNAEFAQELYKTALAALERGRVDAGRTLKMVSVLQQPTHPQYPMQPRRIYNAVVFIIATLMLVGILNLLGIIIREHRD